MFIFRKNPRAKILKTDPLLKKVELYTKMNILN